MIINLLLSLMILEINWAELGALHSGSLLRLQSGCGQDGQTEACFILASGA